MPNHIVAGPLRLCRRQVRGADLRTELRCSRLSVAKRVDDVGHVEFRFVVYNLVMLMRMRS